MAARREIEAEIAELLQRPAVRLEDEALIAAAVRKRVDPTVGIKKKVARLQATLLREANRTCENVPRVAAPPSSTAWARPTPPASSRARTLRQQQRREVSGRGRSAAGRSTTQTPRQQRERASADALVRDSPAEFGRMVHQSVRAASTGAATLRERRHAGAEAVKPPLALPAQPFPPPTLQRWPQEPPPHLDVVPAPPPVPPITLGSLRRQVASIFFAKAAADWPASQLISISKVPQPFREWCHEEFFGPRHFGKGDAVLERAGVLLSVPMTHGEDQPADGAANREAHESTVMADQRLLLFRQLVCDSATTADEAQRALGAELGVAVLVSVCKMGGGVQLHDKPLPLGDVAECVAEACWTCEAQLQARGSQGSEAQDYPRLELIERLQAQGWLKGTETVQKLMGSSIGKSGPLQQAEEDLSEILALKEQAVAKASWGEAAALKIRQHAAEAKVKREAGIEVSSRSRGKPKGGPTVTLDATLAFLLSSVCPVLAVEGLGVPSLGKHDSVSLNRILEEPEVELAPMSAGQVTMHVTQLYLYIAKSGLTISVGNGAPGRKQRLRRITPLPEAGAEAPMVAGRVDLMGHTEQYFGSWVGRVRGRYRAVLGSFLSGLQLHSLQHRAVYVFGRLSAAGWTDDAEDLALTSNSAVRQLGLDCVLTLLDTAQMLRSGSGKTKALSSGQQPATNSEEDKTGDDGGAVDKTKLHVTGLKRGYKDEAELKALFSEYGSVSNVYCRDKNNGKGSWALVTMQESSGAKAALAAAAAAASESGISLGKRRLVVRRFSRKKAEASTGAMRVLITKDKDHIGDVIASRSVSLTIEKLCKQVRDSSRSLALLKDAPDMVAANKSLMKALDPPQRVVSKVCACIKHLCGFGSGAVSMHIVADLVLEALLPALRGRAKVEDEWSPGLADWQKVSEQRERDSKSAKSEPMRLVEVRKTINAIYLANVKAGIFVQAKEDADAKLRGASSGGVQRPEEKRAAEAAVLEWPTGQWRHPMEHYLTKTYFKRMFGVERIAVHSAAAFAVGLADHGNADRKSHVFRLLAGLGVSYDGTDDRDDDNDEERSEEEMLVPSDQACLTALRHFAAEAVTSFFLEVQMRADGAEKTRSGSSTSGAKSSSVPQTAPYVTVLRAIIAIVKMLQVRLPQLHTALSNCMYEAETGYTKLHEQYQAAEGSARMAESMLVQAQSMLQPTQPSEPQPEPPAAPTPRLEGTAAAEAAEPQPKPEQEKATPDPHAESDLGGGGGGAMAKVGAKVADLKQKAVAARAEAYTAASTVRRLKARNAVCEMLWDKVGMESGAAGNSSSDASVYEQLVQRILGQMDEHVATQSAAPKRYTLDECMADGQSWCALSGSLQYEVDLDWALDVFLEHVFPQIHLKFGALDNQTPIVLPLSGVGCGCASCAEALRKGASRPHIGAKSLRELKAAFAVRAVQPAEKPEAETETEAIDAVPEQPPAQETGPLSAEQGAAGEEGEQEPAPEPEPELLAEEPVELDAITEGLLGYETEAAAKAKAEADAAAAAKAKAKADVAAAAKAKAEPEPELEPEPSFEVKDRSGHMADVLGSETAAAVAPEKALTAWEKQNAQHAL
jgi:hypothetical protein